VVVQEEERDFRELEVWGCFVKPFALRGSE
jgi:hypothetical protein